MTGLALLISTITGSISGLIPDVFGEWKAGREHKRELDFLKTQTSLQIQLEEKKIQGRVAELDLEMEIEAMHAESRMLDGQTKLAETQMKTKTGIAWVDAFNAVLRPVFVSAVMILFMATAGMFVYGVMGNESTSLIEKADLIWNKSLIGMSIEAVIGFLFGYRSTVKRGNK